MTKIFLGVDIGSHDSHSLLSDEHGKVLGSGQAGPGNHEVVGYAGLAGVLREVTDQALRSAGVRKERIAAAGFGVSGYDWPAERAPTLRAIRSLGLSAPVELVNDTLLGLVAGAEQGWGIAVVAGSGENCWGRDRHGRVGRMTGAGPLMGEYGGGSAIAAKAIQAVAAEWTHTGPATSLSQALPEAMGARDAEDLIEGLVLDRYRVGAEIAPQVGRAAAQGDAVAVDILGWAGAHLGAMVNGVIRQLGFQREAFDVVQVGGIFNLGALLTDPLQVVVRELAPGARFVPLRVPPVAGAVLLAMQHAGVDLPAARSALIARMGR